MNLNTIFYTAGILLLFSRKENQSNKNNLESNSNPRREKIVTGQQIQKTKKEEDPGQASVQETGSTWKGKYSGSFLRLKDETADPRAWGRFIYTSMGKGQHFLSILMLRMFKKN